MTIVIEIPRKTYEHIRAEGGRGIFNPWMGDDNEIVTKAIFNGTPLPKGHGRLIDADAMQKYQIDTFGQRLLVIDTAPTIIEADKE